MGADRRVRLHAAGSSDHRPGGGRRPAAAGASPGARVRAGRPQPARPAGVPAAGGPTATAVGRATAGQPGPQRGEGVVGQVARPHQVPQHRHERRVVGGRRPRRTAPGRSRRRRRRGRRARRVCGSPSVSAGSGSGRVSGARSARCRLTQPSSPGERAVTGPHDLARRRQLVEQRRALAGHPRRQHQRLQRARRQHRPGELLDDAQHARRPPAGRRGRPARRAATAAGSGRGPTRGTGSTSARRAASERRRSVRSTSASQ